MKHSTFQSMYILVFFFLCFTTVSAQSWTELGSAKVNGHTDHDEIWVTNSRGDFKAIKLFVQNEGIDFDRVVVHFGNGGSDMMSIKNFIPAAGETRVMDLEGGDRVIKKVDFFYKSNAMTSKKARVVLYGKR
jgi:hypothetical protein